MAKKKIKKEDTINSEKVVEQCTPKIFPSFLNEHKIEIVLFLFALVINFLILFEYLGNSPFARSPQWDAQVYWDWAKKIAAGNWLGDSIFHQSPLYPYFIALFIKIFGQNIVPVLFVQMTLSALTTLLVYKIGAKISNKTTGLIAGITYALYGMQVFYSLKLLSECLTILLVVTTIYFLLTNNNYKKFILSGSSFGLLLLAKPYFLLATPFIAGWFLLKNKAQFVVVIKKTTFFLLPVVVLVGMISLRNYIVGNDFVLISSNGGENFYIGNNPEANGTYVPIRGVSQDIKYQNEDVNAVAHLQSGKVLKRSEVSSYWFKKGIQFIRKNPKDYLVSLTKKVKYFFTGAEVSTMYYLYFERANLTKSLAIPFVNFYILLPFVIIGIVYSCLSWKKNILLYLFLCVNVLNIMIFFYDTRFMLPGLPIMILFAAQGGLALFSMLKNIQSLKVFEKITGALFLMTLSFTVFIYTVDKKAGKPDWHQWMTIGDIYYEEGKHQNALEAFLHSSSLNKNTWMPAFGVSKCIYWLNGKEDAAQLYTQAVSNLNDDFKKLIQRDTSLNHIRQYILEKSGTNSPLPN